MHRAEVRLVETIQTISKVRYWQLLLTLNSRGVSRVHGGRFAGMIQAFVPDDLVETYQTAMENIFGPDSCQVLKIRKYGGIKVL